MNHLEALHPEDVSGWSCVSCLDPVEEDLLDKILDGHAVLVNGDFIYAEMLGNYRFGAQQPPLVCSWLCQRISSQKTVLLGRQRPGS